MFPFFEWKNFRGIETFGVSLPQNWWILRTHWRKEVVGIFFRKYLGPWHPSQFFVTTQFFGREFQTKTFISKIYLWLAINLYIL